MKNGCPRHEQQTAELAGLKAKEKKGPRKSISNAEIIVVSIDIKYSVT